MASILVTFAVIRVLIGLGPIVAPGPLVGVFGFPQSEVTPSAIVFARLFGVRDIGLGAIIAWSVSRPEVWPAMMLLNGLTDTGDLLAFLAGMRGRPDLRRPMGMGAAVAGSAALAWLVLGLWVVS